MNRLIAIILLSLLAIGCKIETGSITTTTTHCYQLAGDFLASGQVWAEPDGQVENVFYSYDLKGWDLWFGPADKITKNEISEALDRGERVVIQYKNGRMEHSEPLFNISQIEGKELTWVFIAYPVKEDTQ